MNDHRTKLIFWGSLIIILLSIGGLIYSGMVPRSDLIDQVQMIVALVMVLSILNLIVIFAIRHNERKWMMVTSKISIYIFPVFIISPYIISNYTNLINSDLLLLILAIFGIILGLFVLLNLFIIRDPSEKKGFLIFLSLIAVSVILQKLDILPEATKEFFIPVFVIMTGAGVYIFGIRCLFIIDKNRYLKVVAFLACTLIAFGCYAFLFRMTGDEINSIELIFFIPAFILTLILLFSLPLSGYIIWLSKHKYILNKIMIVWVFFFLIFSIRFIYPDFFKTISLKEKKITYDFYMMDYDLKNKNGLEPD